MSDFSSAAAAAIEPFFELATSTSHEEEELGQAYKSETAGSLPQTPPADAATSASTTSSLHHYQQQPLSDPYLSDDQVAFVPDRHHHHHIHDCVDDEQSCPSIAPMTLHLPFRSYVGHTTTPPPPPTAAANTTQQQLQSSPWHLVSGSPADLLHEVDSFPFRDTSPCDSGAASHFSPASPVDSWASPATSSLHQPDHHHSPPGLDTWHHIHFPHTAESNDLSPTTDDGGGDGSSPASCPGHGVFDSEWQCEHLAASPLTNFVGISGASGPPSPIDSSSLTGSTLTYMAPPIGTRSGLHGLANPDPMDRYRASEPPSRSSSSSYHHHTNLSSSSLSGGGGGGHLVAQSPNGGSAATEGPPYAQLIYRALMSREGHCMSLQEIYQWFRENTEKVKGGGKGWQNSIRHNLSMNQGFIKRERKEAGKNGRRVPSHLDDLSGETKRSTEWTLQDWAIAGGIQSTTRYRQTKVRDGGSGRRAGTSRRSSNGSPYASYTHVSSSAGGPSFHGHGGSGSSISTRSRTYGSRVHGLHTRSASGNMPMAPTSHYYAQASSTAGHPDLSDPYRDQLMQEAILSQGPYSAHGIKRESTPDSSPPPPHSGYAVLPPHGLMHGGSFPLGSANATGTSAYLGTHQPEFPYSTTNVHLAYPHGSGAADAESGNGQSPRAYDANGPHGLYPWNPSQGY